MVVAEPVGHRLKRLEAFGVGLLGGGVHAARREGYGHVMACGLRRSLDRRSAAEDDQVGQRDLFAARSTVIERLLHAFQRPDNLRQLRRVVRRPVLLRGEANARAIGAAAHV